MSNRYFGGIRSATQPTTSNTTSGVASGSWTTTQAAQKTASNAWPAAKTAPGAPTIGTASPGNAQASITFTAPASDGGSAVTSYTATSSPGGVTGTLNQSGSGTITVTGLTASTSYTFTVKATNGVGQSAASSASNSITTIPSSLPPRMNGGRRMYKNKFNK
jgi:hypothetical protein